MRYVIIISSFITGHIPGMALILYALYCELMQKAQRS